MTTLCAVMARQDVTAACGILLSCLVGTYRARVSPLWVYRCLTRYHWRRTLSCSRLLIALLVVVCVAVWALPNLSYLLCVAQVEVCSLFTVQSCSTSTVFPTAMYITARLMMTQKRTPQQ